MTAASFVLTSKQVNWNTTASASQRNPFLNLPPYQLCLLPPEVCRVLGLASPPPSPLSLSLLHRWACQQSRLNKAVGERGASGKKCLSLSPGQPGKRGGEGARQRDRSGEHKGRGQQHIIKCWDLRISSKCVCGKEVDFWVILLWGFLHGCCYCVSLYELLSMTI